MKAKVKLHIKPDGTLVVDTVKNVGTGCRVVADIFANKVGHVLEDTRRDTEDLYKPIEGEQDLHVEN